MLAYHAFGRAFLHMSVALICSWTFRRKLKMYLIVQGTRATLAFRRCVEIFLVT